MSTSTQHVVVVGAGHSGGKVVYHLRDQGFEGNITLIGDEIHHPYERPALSKDFLLGNTTIPSLTLGPAEFWDNPASYQRVHARVTSIDASMRALTLDNGQHISFDHLVLATGGRARNLPLPGFDHPQVRVLRTIADAESLKSELEKAKRLVIIGAGVIGMEVAASATKFGVDVTVLEGGTHIMARCLPLPASEWLASVHTAHGVHIETGVKVQSVQHAEDGTDLAVVTSNAAGEEQRFAADIILVSVGLDFRCDYLASVGLSNEQGIVVNAHSQLPDYPWVYASGDVAITPNPYLPAPMRLETWRNAENQALAIAKHITGTSTEPYVELPWMWSDHYGRNIQVVGVPNAEDDIIVRQALGDGPGSLIFMRGDVITGGLLLDSGRDRRALEQLVASRENVDRAAVADPAIRLKDLL
jgi:3-phenylpropionate/trans-cinnamate dioxygenase ferredoxin reductase subunit